MSDHNEAEIDTSQQRKRTFHETEFSRNSVSPAPDKWLHASSRRRVVEHIPNGLGGMIPVIALDVDVIEEPTPADCSDLKRRSKY